MGQVFAIHGLVPSLLIWLAVGLYSPLLALLSAAGALMGSFLPLLILGTLSLLFLLSHFHLQTPITIRTYTTVSGVTAPSSPSAVLPGRLLHSQGQFWYLPKYHS